MTGAICSEATNEQASDIIWLPIHLPLTSWAHSGGKGHTQLRQKAF